MTAQTPRREFHVLGYDASDRMFLNEVRYSAPRELARALAEALSIRNNEFHVIFDDKKGMNRIAFITTRRLNEVGATNLQAEIEAYLSL